MIKKWQLRKCDEVAAAELAAVLGLKTATAQLLLQRGIATSDAAKMFLKPSLSYLVDPFLLKGADEAVSRLIAARESGESVCVYGDYDVDGISGASLLVSFLRRAGFTCSYFIPNRFDDGYGLNVESLGKIIESGANIIVSVDCGITSVNEALFCRERNTDLIILDHHTPGDVLPDAVAVVNPLQPGCPYPFKSLAGVGVAFVVLMALRKKMRQQGYFAGGDEPDLREWLDFVALGTIADVVPLVGQNRIFAHHGLNRLEKSSRQGVIALKDVAGIKGRMSCGHVGFRLAPRLNAVGRMESAVPGVELLLGLDPVVCRQIAQELDIANSERQNVEREIFEQAVALIESGSYPDCKSIVCASTGWHQGVVGIVASRIVERYHRPTILLAISEDGTAKGSGRSIPGFHLLDALKGCSDLLERFGGHRYAAGMSLKTSDIEQFIAKFEAESAIALGDSELLPLLEIDLEIKATDLNPELANELKKLEPFGAGNAEPLFLLKDVEVTERRIVGEKHLKLKINKDGGVFDAIAFSQAECETAGRLDIAFFPEINVWKQTESLQLRIKAIRSRVL